jgi:hypothetical protein
MDTDGRFPTPTTRRTIVATGAKLAYAAPLVATSLRLSTLNVAATHSPGHVCKGEICESVVFGCDGDLGCVCFLTVENTGFCHRGQSCEGLQSCDSSADCPAGYACSIATCCGPEQGQICIQPCAGTQGLRERDGSGPTTVGQ